ncbi:hypothetical protein P7K49_037311 [Saguinus oedipus]|uniref:Uncharacterized protein n=1 Tax=Saguinus oedipus TaxID=9490 RepID=A0ABQ9TIK9_SAGOE|nr:hypothetical protein P7K49_037311 [Saguinus oedipus]
MAQVSSSPQSCGSSRSPRSCGSSWNPQTAGHCHCHSSWSSEVCVGGTGGVCGGSGSSHPPQSCSSPQSWSHNKKRLEVDMGLGTGEGILGDTWEDT